jgi:glutamyl-tRNA reductase
MLLGVGIAQRDAPAPQPERLALPAVHADLQARAMAACYAEALVMSNCSRTELHTVLDSASVQRLRSPMNVITCTPTTTRERPCSSSMLANASGAGPSN